MAIGPSTDFLGLTDTPASYAGQAGKFAQVNGAEDGLQFATDGVQNGAAFPAPAASGDLFIIDTVGMFFYDGTSWVMV